MLLLTVLSLFSLIVVGAYVTAANDGSACGSAIGTDYPLCQGSIFPPLQAAPIAEWSHRVLASLSALFLFVTTLLFWRAKDSVLAVRTSLYVATVLIIFEIVLGAAVVVAIEPAWLVTLHQADAMLVFGVTVAATALSLGRSS
jgi:cytochrome c oxidase assembly protein subunit 15